MKDNIILYTTHCPKCAVLEKKMQQKGIIYKSIDDEAIIESLGFEYLPVTRINNQYFDFKQTVDYINSID